MTRREITDNVRFCRKVPLAASSQTRMPYQNSETCGVRNFGWIRPKAAGISPCSAIAKVRRETFSVTPAR